jgi:hypothetical protein
MIRLVLEPTQPQILTGTGSSFTQGTVARTALSSAEVNVWIFTSISVHLYGVGLYISKKKKLKLNSMA